MIFKLNITCDNAAFNQDDPETEGSFELAAVEVARILQDCAKHVVNGSAARAVHDTNGNRVGSYAFYD